MSALFVIGCSGAGFNFENKRTMIITKSPYQIAISGDVDELTVERTMQIVHELSRYPYIDYRFNENLLVNLESSDVATSSTTNVSSSTKVRPSIYDVQP